LPIHKSDFINYLTFDLLDQCGLKHGVFQRHGGCSPSPFQSLNMATSVGDSRENVIENRKRLTTTIGLNISCVYDVWQIHSTNVAVASNPRLLYEDHRKADAIVSSNPDIGLLMVFADCVPILFFDPKKSVIGIAHAGWKGTVDNIVGETIKVFKNQFQSAPDDIITAIGPSICSAHYSIGNEVSDQVKKVFLNEPQVLAYYDGNIHFDLNLANEILLRRSGVQMIENVHICTACHPEDWYSHRGENGYTGRFGAIISNQKYG